MPWFFLKTLYLHNPLDSYFTWRCPLTIALMTLNFCLMPQKAALLGWNFGDDQRGQYFRPFSLAEERWCHLDRRVKMESFWSELLSEMEIHYFLRSNLFLIRNSAALVHPSIPLYHLQPRNLHFNWKLQVRTDWYV